MATPSPHLGPHTQQSRGVEICLRARDIRLHDPTALPTRLAIGLDAAQQRNQLEALRAALANVDAHPEPFAATAANRASPTVEGNVGWALEPFHPLGREEAVRPRRDVRPPLMVEAGAIPESLRGVQAEGVDDPLDRSGPYGVVGDL